MRILSNVFLIFLCLPYLGNGATTGAQQITVATAGGSVIQVQPSSDTFMFGVMQPDGTTKPQQFKYDEMREILLTDNPIANIQADVITLVEQLGDDDFTQRELAEAKLSQSQFAGRFEKLLRNYRDHPNLEIRYRIRRVLASLVDSTTPVPAQDRLILKSGEHFSGDANELRIEGQFLGLPIQLERQQIRQISIANPRTPAPATSKSIKVEKLLSHVDQFYNNGDDFFFDFESDPYGNSISLSERLNDSFYPKGLRLSSNDTDYVRAVRFSFKFCPLDSGSKSACVQGERMFRGVMHIRFCLPGQPDIAAAVTRFGLFIERVDHSRDFVVEAFDANGNIVSLIETTDEDCCFAGFQSNVPITEVRIQQNPYLKTLVGRQLDEMYAVDNLTFNRPVGVATPSDHSILKLKSGNYLSLTSLQQGEQHWQANIKELNQPISIPLEDIAWYQTANPVATVPDQWRALLSDGSVIMGNMGESFQPADDRLTIEAKQIVGLWPSGKPAMYANLEDFESNLPVLVFPGCRVLAKDFTQGKQKMTWDTSSEFQLQPVRLKGRERQGEEDDVRPAYHSVDYDDTPRTPTVWLKSPKTIHPENGFVTTTSGSRYVFGPDGLFVLKTISADQVMLSFPGGEVRIPMKEVSNVSFGQTE